MKIKKSKLDYIYNTLYDIEGFLLMSLGFIDDYQIEYVEKMLSNIDNSLKYLDKVNKGE